MDRVNFARPLQNGVESFYRLYKYKRQRRLFLGPE